MAPEEPVNPGAARQPWSASDREAALAGQPTVAAEQVGDLLHRVPGPVDHDLPGPEVPGQDGVGRYASS